MRFFLHPIHSIHPSIRPNCAIHSLSLSPYNNRTIIHFTTQAKQFDASQFTNGKGNSNGNSNSSSTESSSSSSSQRKKLRKPKGPRINLKEEAKKAEKAKLKREYRMIGLGILCLSCMVGYYFYHISQSPIGRADKVYKQAIEYQTQGENKRQAFIKYYIAKMEKEKEKENIEEHIARAAAININNYSDLIELSKEESLRLSNSSNKSFDFESDFDRANNLYLAAIKLTDSKYAKYLQEYSLFLQKDLQLYDKSEEYIIKAIEAHSTNALYHRQLTELLELPEYDLTDPKWSTNVKHTQRQAEIKESQQLQLQSQSQSQQTQESQESQTNDNINNSNINSPEAERIYHPLIARRRAVEAHLQEASYFFLEENDIAAGRMHLDYALNYVIKTDKIDWIVDTYSQACKLLYKYNEKDLCSKYWNILINNISPIYGRCNYGIFLYETQRYTESIKELEYVFKNEQEFNQERLEIYKQHLINSYPQLELGNQSNEHVLKNKLELFLSSLPLMTPIALTFLGKIYYDQEKYTEAMKYYGMGLQTNTMNVICIGDMILCLIKLNEYKHALQLLNESMDFLISQTKEHGGTIGMEQGFSEKHLTYLNAVKYYLYGKISCNIGVTGNEYSDIYQNLISGDNSSINGSSTSNKRLEDAIKELNLSEKKRMDYYEKSNVGFFEMVREYPNDFFVNYLAAKHYFENTNEMEKANQYFRVAIQMEEDYAVGQYDFAMFLISRGDLQAGKRHLDKALQLNPTIPRIRKTYDQVFHS